MFPSILLVRHGETEWSASGRHTGRTDLPLTSRGERDGIALANRLHSFIGWPASTSPLRRANRTAELAGFGSAVIDPDLVEWDYGEFDGLKTAEIRQQRPGWELFRDGCPGGEIAADVATRADRVIARLRSANSNAVVFSSAHFLRVLAVRWLGLPVESGRMLYLNTASISEIGYDHGLSEPCIRLWNDTGHLTNLSPS